MLEKKNYRPININPCLNGFVVTIGCQTAVFNDGNDMVASLKFYLEDPQGMEKKWLANSLCGESVPRPMQPEEPVGQSTRNMERLGEIRQA